MKKINLSLLILISVAGYAYASSEYVAIIGAERNNYGIGTPHVVGTQYGEWSDFERVGTTKNCDTFTAKSGSAYPKYDYISHTSSIYRLSLDCEQDYTQKRDVFDLMSNGELVKTGEESNDKTEKVETIVIKDAMKEDVYVSENYQSYDKATYISFSQDAYSTNWYYARVYVNGERIFYQSSGNGRDYMINQLASYGYVLGEEVESKRFAIRMNNAASINVWKVSSMEDLSSQSACGSTTIDDYWNYEGYQCSTSGTTKTVCTNFGYADSNNGDWKRVQLTCESW